MFSINKTSDAAKFLHFSHHMKCNRCLTGRLRSVNLNNTSLRYTSETKRKIQTERSCRYCLYIHILRVISKLHDGSFAIMFLNIGNGCIKGFHLIRFICFLCSIYFIHFACHKYSPYRNTLRTSVLFIMIHDFTSYVNDYILFFSPGKFNLSDT